VIAASKRENTTDEFETENIKAIQNIKSFSNIKRSG
jgi:hypothetical protein